MSNFDDFMIGEQVKSNQEMDALRVQRNNMRTAILLILDAVDYTSGSCRVNELVGAVLPKEIIQKARESLKS